MGPHMLHVLLVDASRLYGFPVTLLKGIVQAESGGDPWAMRYEAAFQERFVPKKPHVFGAVSYQTERVALATSWGLMQIMGLTARERGFRGAFLSQLCDPQTGVEWGCKHLTWLRDQYFEGEDWAPVVAAYNAGSPQRDRQGAWINAAYVEKVLGHLRA